MLPKLITIAGFSVYTYGVLVALAFVAGLTVAVANTRSLGLNSEKSTNLAVYSALAGLVGSKLLMFAFDWPYYSSQPSAIFSLATLQAAGVFQGGLIAGAATGLLYMKRAALPLWPTLDAFAPGIAIGHAIGRLGCLAAGCCWGVSCDRPWAITYTNPEAGSLSGVPLGVPLHPAPLYETGLLVLLFLWLRQSFARPHAPGTVFAQYLALSSLVRFGVEFYRHHEQALPFGLPLSITQWIALVLAAVGALLWLRRGPSAAIATP